MIVMALMMDKKPIEYRGEALVWENCPVFCQTILLFIITEKL